MCVFNYILKNIYNINKILYDSYFYHIFLRLDIGPLPKPPRLTAGLADAPAPPAPGLGYGPPGPHSPPRADPTHHGEGSWFRMVQLDLLG